VHPLVCSCCFSMVSLLSFLKLFLDSSYTARAIVLLVTLFQTLLYSILFHAVGQSFLRRFSCPTHSQWLRFKLLQWVLVCSYHRLTAALTDSCHEHYWEIKSEHAPVFKKLRTG
jgi:hypothetical protein